MACPDKNKYSKKTAEKVAIIQRQKGWKIRVYQCKYCRMFHLTKSKGEIRDQL